MARVVDDTVQLPTSCATTGRATLASEEVRRREEP